MFSWPSVSHSPGSSAPNVVISLGRVKKKEGRDKQTGFVLTMWRKRRVMMREEEKEEKTKREREIEGMWEIKEMHQL